MIAHSVLAAWAEASQPPPEMTPGNDARPQYWVEIAKSGDMWMLSKDGG
jgi:hypothetical protein